LWQRPLDCSSFSDAWVSTHASLRSSPFPAPPALAKPSRRRRHHQVLVPQPPRRPLGGRAAQGPAEWGHIIRHGWAGAQVGWGPGLRWGGGRGWGGSRLAPPRPPPLCFGSDRPRRVAQLYNCSHGVPLVAPWFLCSASPPPPSPSRPALPSAAQAPPGLAPSASNAGGPAAIPGLGALGDASMPLPGGWAARAALARRRAGQRLAAGPAGGQGLASLARPSPAT
jgi:hypothetical protein